MVVSRLAKYALLILTQRSCSVHSTFLMVHLSTLKQGNRVKPGDLIAKWDPFNAVIVSEYAGTLKFHDVVEGVTFHAETDDTTGLTEKIITDSKDKSKVPTCDIIGADGEVVGTYNFHCRRSRCC